MKLTNATFHLTQHARERWQERGNGRDVREVLRNSRLLRKHEPLPLPPPQYVYRGAVYAVGSGFVFCMYSSSRDTFVVRTIIKALEGAA